MKTSVFRFASVATLCVLLGAARCSVPPGVDVIVLVDYSESIDEDTRAFFASVISDHTLSHMTVGDSLAVFPIDKAAEQRRESLYAASLAEDRFAQDSDGFAQRDMKIAARVSAFVDEQRAIIKAAVEDGVKRRKVDQSGTDIVGAFAALSPAETHQVIVLLSDMEQVSPELDLRKHTDDSDAAARKLVETLAAANRIPRLPGGTQVVVVGAGESSRDAKTFRAHRQFWQAFIRAAGGSLADADYGFRTQQRIGEAIRTARTR